MSSSSDLSSFTGLHVIDYVIFVAFLVISGGIGIFYACRGGQQKTNSEFLMGNRKLKTLPVAISMVVSFISGILVLGHPAEMYTRGTQFSMRMLGHALACILSTVLFVPLFFRLRVTSSFEYLEARYESKCVKLIGTITMLISMLLQMGIVLYAPAVALQAVNNIPVWISILVTSTLAIIYTTLGGMKAVIWTDVFQAACMIIGMLAIVILGTLQVGNFEKVWNINARDGRIDFFNFDPDPTVRASFWSTVFGAACTSLSVYGVGQTTVQRFCALPTLRQAKCSVLLNAVFLVLLYALATAVGLVIYAYYADIGCDPLRARYITSQNQLVPYFVRNVLGYPGLPGVFLAVLFGGALSTISSNLNSAAAITWQDILKYFFEHLSENKRAIITKLLVVVFGAVGIGIAFSAKFMGSHVLQAVTTVMGTFSGPVLGIFVLGVLFPFANAKGAVIGSSLATAINIWITIGSLILNPHRTTLPTTTEKCNVSSSSSSASINVYNYTTNPTLSDEFTTRFISDTEGKLFYKNYTDGETTFYNHNERESPGNALNYLYSISFNLFPIVGLFNTLIIGILASLITGSRNVRKVSPHLVVPFFDLFCCFLPASVRRHLRCGVEFDGDKSPPVDCTIWKDSNNMPFHASLDLKVDQKSGINGKSNAQAVETMLLQRLSSTEDIHL